MGEQIRCRALGDDFRTLPDPFPTCGIVIYKLQCGPWSRFVIMSTALGKMCSMTGGPDWRMPERRRRLQAESTGSRRGNLATADRCAQGWAGWGLIWGARYRGYYVVLRESSGLPPRGGDKTK